MSPVVRKPRAAWPHTEHICSSSRPPPPRKRGHLSASLSGHCWPRGCHGLDIWIRTSRGGPGSWRGSSKITEQASSQRHTGCTCGTWPRVIRDRMVSRWAAPGWDTGTWKLISSAHICLMGPQASYRCVRVPPTGMKSLGQNICRKLHTWVPDIYFLNQKKDAFSLHSHQLPEHP